jgi:bifunctional non-homologous end joining protein LigD
MNSPELLSRLQLHIANEAARVFTRNGNDWTKRFRKSAADAS